MKPTFATLDGTTGFEVVDPIETRRFAFETPSPVGPRPVDPGAFPFPVSSSCVVETAALECPYVLLAYVRDADGEVVADLAHDESAAFPRDEYLLELNAPVKLYLRFESELRIESDTESMRVEFGAETSVEVGARSFHESPEATITVPDDPEGVMAAVSTFGSGLKTTSCERSWPTLRGHPPRVERGDDLVIPDGLDAPDTGVTIEVPPEYDAIYPVAPLAYYFGGEVVPGETPRLTVGGFERRFDAGDGFEDEAVRTLKQAFFFDCVVRTEGYYPVGLAERKRVESLTDLDLRGLYDAPLDEQLDAYLSVPYETVVDAMPTWHRVAYVRPDPENVETLPSLVNDFTILRTPPSPEYDETEEMRETRDAIDDFKRKTPEVERQRDAGGDEAWRGVPPLKDYVQMPDADALELAWVGDGTPIRGTKVLREALQNGISETDEGVIDITVVCNDEGMRDEWDAVAEIYAARNTVDFDIDVYFGVSMAELGRLLQTPTDLFHYIGHIDGRGFECPDGMFDARALNEVAAEAFLLNACRSHDQGIALVDAGARSGIVSLGNVANRVAIEFGETLAKLVHNGFSVGGALAITRKYMTVGTHYIALGDPGLTLTQSDDVIPLMYVVEEETSDGVLLTVYGYPTRDHPIGGISMSYLEDGPHFLSTGPYEIQTSREQMRTVFQDMRHTPLVIDGDLVLSREWMDEQ